VVGAGLAAAIDAQEPAALSGEAFRHIAESRNPLSGEGARLQGGRWSPPASFATLYLALERDTAVCELRRLAERSNRAPDDFLPRRFYRYELELTALLDLREPAAREAVGLTDRNLVSNVPDACQAIGEAVHHLGREGVVAPSATGAGTVVAVFADRLVPGSHVRELDYELWESPPRLSGR
jgi:RES domain-containing protein